MATVSTPADTLQADVPAPLQKPKDTNPTKKVVMDAMVKNFSQNAYVSDAAGNGLQIVPPVIIITLIVLI
jgi:hypothetical protein